MSEPDTTQNSATNGEAAVNEASAPAETAAAPAAPAEPTAEERYANALAEVAKLRDQLLRTAADFDNFRKRTRREIDDSLKRGKESTVKDLLPVFDNFGRNRYVPARMIELDGVVHQIGDDLFQPSAVGCNVIILSNLILQSNSLLRSARRESRENFVDELA